MLLARISRARVFATADPRVLVGLFLLAVAVGSVGRWWHRPEHLVNSFDRWQTAATGAIAAICLNNLPAAMLLSANPPAHSRALLIGLNLGPNLAVTGSLSAVLWLRVARSNDARPSARTTRCSASSSCRSRSPRRSRRWRFSYAVGAPDRLG